MTPSTPGLPHRSGPSPWYGSAAAHARRLATGLAWAGLAALLGSCASTSPGTPAPVTVQPLAIGRAPAAQAAVTAHPLATRAALEMLAAGGSAADAAIAAQWVLGLVEPQSSGPGGGSVLLVWDAARARLHSYDGLAAAPARTTASLRTDVDGRPLDGAAVARSGRSVGVPGTPAVLEMVHRRHGRLPWSRLVEPALRLAENGYPMARYVHDVLVPDRGGLLHADWRGRLFDATGAPMPVGTTLRNPAYAAALRRLAGGVQAFWADGAAERLVDSARRPPHPSLMTAADVRGYAAREHEPLCAPFLGYRVCSMGPPSFGGLAVLQTLQIVQSRVAAPFDLDSAAFWHVYAEAGRLAQADRRFWVGDPAYTVVPTQTLLAPSYLRERAALIDPDRALPAPGPGKPRLPPVARVADEGAVHSATSQVTVADARGMVVTLTTTINLNFGSRLAVDGFGLNNALTNFAPAPPAGTHSANQMAPGKRPVTSMAPVIVFDATGRPVVAGGSAGGGQIVDYVARALVQMLAQDQGPDEAVAPGHLSTAQAPRVQIEAGSPRERVAAGLRARGHDVVVERMLSGLGFLRRDGAGWIGAADPRRDGVALGLPAAGSGAGGPQPAR